MAPITFIACRELYTRTLAPVVNSFFRVTRRVNEGHLVRFGKGKTVTTSMTHRHTTQLHAVTPRTSTPTRRSSHSYPSVLSHRERRTRTPEVARPFALPAAQPDVVAEKVQPSRHDEPPPRTVAESRPLSTRRCDLILRRHVLSPTRFRVSSFGLFSPSFMSAFQISFTVLLRYLSTPYI